MSRMKIRLPFLKFVFGEILILAISLLYYFAGYLSWKEVMPLRCFLYSTIATLLVIWFDRQKAEESRRVNLGICLLAFIYSQFITIGHSFYQVQNWDLCFGDFRTFLIWLIQSCCYAFIIYKIAHGIFNNILNHKPESSSYQLNYKKVLGLFLCTRIVFFIAHYPCIFDFDSASGLHTLMDSESANCDHHPFMVQLIHGAAFMLGKNLGHLSVGFAILSISFIFVSTHILIYGIKQLKGLGMNKNWTIFLVVVFSFFPLFPYLSIYPTKDGFFAYFFLFYLFTIIDFLRSCKNHTAHTHFIILHCIAVLLLCLTRHQGFYIVGIETFLLVCCYRRSMKSILTATLPSLIIFFCFKAIVLPYYDVEPGGKQELYGTLFQQTARYLKYHGDDISTNELETIDKVIDPQKIADNYKEGITDPVKNLYKYNPWYRIMPNSLSLYRHVDKRNESEALSEYLSVWTSMFCRHPLCHLQATLGVFSGFFYNMDYPLINTYTRWATNNSATSEEYRFWHINCVADYYFRHKTEWVKNPIFGWALAIPYYLWACIFFLSFLFFQKDKRGIVLFFPVLFSIIILMICPTVDGRYTFPIVIALPILICYIFAQRSNNNTSQTSSLL